MAAPLELLPKLLSLACGGGPDGEIIAAIGKIKALVVSNDWQWEQLLATNGAATSFSEGQLQRVFQAGLERGEQLGYQRGLADGQTTGAIKPDQPEIGDDISWAKSVFEAAVANPTCLREGDVDFANERLASFQRWGKSAFFTQRQHNYAKVIEIKLKQHGFL